MDMPMLPDGLNPVWMAAFSIVDKTHTWAHSLMARTVGSWPQAQPCLFVSEQAHPPSRPPWVPTPVTKQFWVTPYSPPATGMLCL